MIKVFALLTALLLSLVSCAPSPGPPLPPILGKPAAGPACGTIFPAGDWRYVHTIRFRLANGGQGNVIGVIAIDPPRLQCVLMTVEGFVLFKASFDGRLEIRRAVPPFDSKNFARGLIADLQLIFLPPPGRMTAAGRLKNGDRICRYATQDGGITDLIHGPGPGWEIERYNRDRILVRTVRARFQAGSKTVPKAVPTDLELTAPGLHGYRLQMHLIRAEAIQRECKNKKGV